MKINETIKSLMMVITSLFILIIFTIISSSNMANSSDEVSPNKLNEVDSIEKDKVEVIAWNEETSDIWEEEWLGRSIMKIVNIDMEKLRRYAEIDLRKEYKEDTRLWLGRILKKKYIPNGIEENSLAVASHIVSIANTTLFRSIVKEGGRIVHIDNYKEEKGI